MARSISYQATAPGVWALRIDGVDTGVTISAPDTPEAATALVRLAELVKLGEGAETYVPHFRAYSEATNARQELPKEDLPAEVLDGLNQAAAVVRELKAEIAKPVTARG